MIQEIEGGKAVLLQVKVVPGASRTRFVEEWNGRAKFAVAAPPDKGKANKELIEFLADRLGLRRSDFSIVAGQTSPRKTIRIARASAVLVRTGLIPART